MTLSPVMPLWVLAILAVGLVVLGVLGLRSQSTRRGRIDAVLRLVMVALLIVIAVRPVIPGTSTGAVASGGLEVYFVVDTTSSMAAEDGTVEAGSAEERGSLGSGGLGGDGSAGDAAPTRLDQAKADIAGITAGLAGAQFSLTTFDGSTVQRVPLTSDATALQSAANAMTQEITAYSRGSSIDEPVQFMTDLLVAAAAEHPDRRRVLFYLGDGEQTQPQEPGSFSALAPFIGGGGVLEYGSPAGGVMRSYAGLRASEQLDVTRYIQDPSTGEDAISIPDRGNLETIASALQVPLQVRDGETSAAALTSGIDVGAVSVSAPTSSAPIEFYWIAAIPLGLLALRELALMIVALRGLRSATPVAAPTGDRGGRA